VGYNAVADNTDHSSFIYLLLLPIYRRNPAKLSENSNL